MDKSAKLAYKMIEVAINKAIREIEENPFRGVRNILDLLTYLFPGRFLQDFLKMTRQMLNNPNSPYYDLTRHILKNVDHTLLKNFFICLSYNCLTYGTQKIRVYEKAHGYKVPRTMVFDLRYTAGNRLSAANISKFLLQGESIGIYCGMFVVDQNQTYLTDLIEVLSAHQDSAFFIFAVPEAITPASADALTKSGNIMAVLAAPTYNNSPSFVAAAEELMAQKCLYGAFIRYGDNNFRQAVEAISLPQIRNAHCACVFLIRDELKTAGNKKHFSQLLQKVRSAHENPFFLIDFYEDIANVDRNISVEDCFLAIKSTGDIAFNARTGPSTGFNIRDCSLETILKNIMPPIQ